MTKQEAAFYGDMRKLMDKYGLVMECYDQFDAGVFFSLRSKNKVDGKYTIHVIDVEEFVDNISGEDQA